MLNDILDRIKLPFRKDQELYSSLRQIIGFYPRHIEYYKTALLHKSIDRRNEKGKPVNNERLEFLGDAILDAVVGDIVYQHFPGKREGFLTNTRSKIVQRETLGRLAKEMGVSRLILSNGRGQSHNSYMGGNAFEALVGAIYLDRGYDACMRFMKKQVLNQIINIDKVAYKEVNFKSKLIEWTQKNRVSLEFRLLDQKKDENASPVFKYMVVLEGVEGCSGTGYSKKESQQLASKLTLERLRKKPQFIDEVFAAKTNRTKMEEEPTTAVPNTNESEDFIISHPTATAEPQPTEKVERREPQQPKKKAAAAPAEKADKPKKAAKKADKGNKATEKETPKAEKKASNAAQETQKAEPQEGKTPEKPAQKSNTADAKPQKAAQKIKESADAKPQKESSKAQKESPKAKEPKKERPKKENRRKEPEVSNPVENTPDNDDEEFDLSHISAREQSREEIIAAAEAAAFAEAGQA